MKITEVKKVKLPEKLQKYLQKQPEDGMGYHKVGLVVKKGEILKDRTILNGEDLLLKEGETIETKDIYAFYSSAKKE